MSKVRNQFTTEFKQECVNLVVNQGYGIAQAASAMQVFILHATLGWAI